MNPDQAWDAFSGRLFDQNAFAIKLGLDNIRRALELEGHPEASAPAIVVGGTNGKGSTAAAIAGILQSHGLSVGLYTSPHLMEVRERFRIDGRPASREEVLEVGKRALDRYAAPDADPCLTFFELTTLIAALIFERHSPDVVVWEVGLGGRLDAVNAIEPAMTVITNIALDHEKYLGETIADVAAEKAALRRPGVPLMLAPQDHPQVLEIMASDDTTTIVAAENPEEPGIDWDNDYVSNRSSFENQITAMRAARRFLGDDWDITAAVTGLARVRWPGRTDPRTVERTGTRFLLDAAHNPAGAERLLQLLKVEPPSAFVIGAMTDKNHEGMFGRLAQFDVPIYIAEIDSARAAAPADLKAVVGDEAVSGPPHEMFEAAATTDDGSYVSVFGSIYLLGEWFAWAEVPVDALVTYR